MSTKSKGAALVILIIFGVTSLKAQGDSFLSYNILNPSLYNAAWVGLDNEASVLVQLRSQWTGYKTSFDGNGGAPSTQILSMMIPVMNKFSGIGLSVANESLGPVNTLKLNMPLSYKLDFKRSQLSLGLMPGIISRTQNFNELRFNDPSDPFNVGTKETQTLLNLGLGALYFFPNRSFVGLGINNLLQPRFDFGLEGSNNRAVANYILNAGISKVFGEGLEVRPNASVRTDLTSHSVDLGFIAYYQSKLWLGTSYRWSEAIVLMVGFSLIKDINLKLGYALDVITSNSEAKEVTSHEIFVKYHLKDFTFGGKKKVKTPRFIN